MFAFVRGRARSGAQEAPSKLIKGGALEEFDAAAAARACRSRSCARVYGPDANDAGTLTEPRQFNLMFKTYVGATAERGQHRLPAARDRAGHLPQLQERRRHHRACKVPFGIAQIGKAFRNEVTPRNFIFRSREFEQMEMEWFCHPDEAQQVVRVLVRDRASSGGTALGVEPATNLQLRAHEQRRARALRQGRRGHGRHRVPLPVHRPRLRRARGRRAPRRLRPAAAPGALARPSSSTSTRRRSERYLPHVIEPAAGLTAACSRCCARRTRDDERARARVS